MKQKLFIFIAMLLPFIGSSQIIVNKVDTSLGVVIGPNIVKWKSWEWTQNLVDSTAVKRSQLSMMPQAGKVPIFSPQGLLNTGIPQFPENAVPLVYLDQRLSESSEYTDNAISGLRVGQSNGVATLGPDGKIPLDMINVSGLTPKGAWNPLTNTPFLINGTGNIGDLYKAGEDGTYNFGNGDYTFRKGDWVIYALGVWQRLASSESVGSVNGYVGQVVLDFNDVGALPDTYVPSWSNISNKPMSMVTNIDEAVSKRHDHNNKSVLDDINSSGLSISYNGNVLTIFPSSNNSVPIRDNNGSQSSMSHTPTATVNTIVSRNAAGTFSATDPTQAQHVATKAYVDSKTQIIAFLASRNTARSVSTGVNPLGCNRIEYSFGGGYNNTGDVSTFTAPVSGIYRFDASVFLGSGNVTGGWVGINVTSALSTTQNGERKFNNVTGMDKIYTLTGGCEIRLQAGDTVQGRFYTSASTNILSTTATWFSGRLLYQIQ